MKYQLDENQSYDTTELQTALNDAGIIAAISGHGDRSFTIFSDEDEAAIDTVVQVHINALARDQRKQARDVKAYIDQISKAVQAVLDKEAVAAGYDSIHTAVTYANETAVGRFSTEGKSFRRWRSLVWDYCYALLAQYELGEIPAPTIEEVIAGLPARV